MALEDATLVKPPRIDYILRSETSSDEFKLEGEMIVGREVECAIALNSGHISRYHAKINVMRSGVYLEDLHSTNGTYINGRKIKGRVRLSLGDEVTFDDVAFRVVSAQSGEQDATLLGKRHNDEYPTQPIPKAPRPEVSKAPSPKAEPADHPDPRQPEQKFPPHSNVKPLPVRKAQTPTPAPEPDEPERAGTAPEPSQKPKDSTSSAPFSSDKGKLPEPPADAPLEDSESDSLLPGYDGINPGEDLDEDDEDNHTRLISSTQLQGYVARNQDRHQELEVGSGPRLIIMTAPLRGKYYELKEEPMGAHWSIGRALECEVRLTDQTISSDHARLAKTPEGYLLSATHAKNGIVVNGETTSSTYLAHGDKIQIGSTELFFRDDTPEPGQPSSQAEPGMSLMHAVVGAIVIGVAVLTVVLTAKG